MKSNRSGRKSQQYTRCRSASLAFVFLFAAAVAVPSRLWQRNVTINVGGSLAADRTYYIRVIATDPTCSNVPFSTQTPLPPFFTGAQAIGDAFVLPFAQTGQVFWGANVMGLGRVEVLSPAGLGPFNEGLNVQDHSLLLTSPPQPTSTAYPGYRPLYKVYPICNAHRIQPNDEMFLPKCLIKVSRTVIAQADSSALPAEAIKRGSKPAIKENETNEQTRQEASDGSTDLLTIVCPDYGIGSGSNASRSK